MNDNTSTSQAAQIGLPPKPVASSSDSTLSDLILYGGSIYDGFGGSGFSSFFTSYHAQRPFTKATVFPTTNQAGATVTVAVNGGTAYAVTSGYPSRSLPLNLGSNTVTVRVTAEDGVTTTTYTITVTRVVSTSPYIPRSGKLTGLQVANAYGIPYSDGAGIKIAIQAFGGAFYQADLDATFDDMIASGMFPPGTVAPTINLVSLSGLDPKPNPAHPDFYETTLDIACVATVVPGATITVYQGDYADTIPRMIADGVDILTVSYTGNEYSNPPGEALWASLAANHIAMLAATGDYGSKTGSIKGPGYPAVSPYVMGVGGTTLTLNSNGTINTETDSNGGGGGGGGGVSVYFSLPSWQSGLSYTPITGHVIGSPTSLTMRGIPDVALAWNDYIFYENDGTTAAGGTSASSPVFAGILARVQKLTGIKRSSPEYNDLFYSFASLMFRDITVGRNDDAIADGYAGTTGWDAVTGLGPPNGETFLSFLYGPTVSTLRSLTINAGTLSPAFASGTTSYTASVDYSTTAISLTAATTQAFASLTKNGSSWNGTSSAVSLNVGTNTITIVATSQDTGHTTTYTITVTRAAYVPFLPATGYLTPPQVANAYNIPYSDGAGIKIGIFCGGGGFLQSDLDNAISDLVLSGLLPNGTVSPTINTVLVPGSGQTGVFDPGDYWAVENTVDIYCIATIVPAATITCYFSNSIPDAITRMVSDGVDFINISYAQLENNGCETALAAAAAAHITVCVASGDYGSAWYPGSGGNVLNANYPSSSPNAISIGGTKLILNVDGTVASESDDNRDTAYGADWGGGGGVSQLFNLPSWQTGLSYTPITGGVLGSPTALTMRGVPDISAAMNGYAHYFNGGTALGTGGTSLASPVIVGILARIQKLTGKKRSSAEYNAIFYRHAATMFRDITVGTNNTLISDGYAGTTSWDPVTGLGPPSGTNFYYWLSASDVATLSALTISSGTLTPAFGSGTISYTASVVNATSSINLTATTTQGNATITLNGSSWNGSSSAVSLNVGSNTITIVVTAQDTVTTKTYTITVTRAAAAATYTPYTPGGTSSVNEGGLFLPGVNTTNVANGTTIYWAIVNGTTSNADFTLSPSGSFNITSNTGHATILIKADTLTEGPETFQIEYRTGSQSGTLVATGGPYTINDTSLTPSTYEFTGPPTSFNEGASVSFNVTTSGVTNGTTLYWTVNHVTTVDADFSAVSGSFTINSNAGSFSVSAIADRLTEGSETFTVSVRTVSISGSVVLTSDSVTVNDTSLSLTVVRRQANQVFYTGVTINSTQTVVVNGGVTPYTYSIDPPLTAITFNSNTGRLSGTPHTTLTTTTFTVTVTDSASGTAFDSFDLEIVQSPTVPLTFTRLLAGKIMIIDQAITPFSIASASGGEQPYVYSLDKTLPTGLVFDTNTGVISGTPTALYPIQYFYITVTDYLGRNTRQSFYLKVVLQPLVASPTQDLFSFIHAVPSTPVQSVTVTGGYPPYSYSINPALGELVFNTATSYISGTAYTPFSTITYTVSVLDSQGQSTFATFGIEVNMPATLTRIVNTSSLSYLINNPITPVQPVTAVPGGGYGVVHYEVGPALPSGLSFSNSTGYISGTPSELITGRHYTIVVRDESDQYIQTDLYLTVYPPELSRIRYTLAKFFRINNAITPFITITGSGGYGSYSYSISPSLPTGLSFNTSNAQITGTPTVISSRKTYTITVTDSAGQTVNTPLDITTSDGSSNPINANSIVTADDYNIMQSNCELVLVGTYGVSVTSSQVNTSTVITYQQWLNLYEDVYKLRAHQTNQALSIGTPTLGQFLTHQMGELLRTESANAYTNRFVCDQRQTENSTNGAVSTRTSSWGGGLTISHETVWTWETPAAMQYWLNLGGFIKPTYSYTVGSGAADNANMKNLIDRINAQAIQVTGTNAVSVDPGTIQDLDYTNQVVRSAHQFITVNKPAGTITGRLNVYGGLAVDIQLTSSWKNYYSVGTKTPAGIGAPRPGVQTSIDLETNGALSPYTVPTKILTPDATALDYPTFYPFYRSIDKILTLTNTGNQAVTVTKMTITKISEIDVTSDYSFTLPKTLQPGQSISVRVNYFYNGSDWQYTKDIELGILFYSDNDAGTIKVPVYLHVKKKPFNFKLQAVNFGLVNVRTFKLTDVSLVVVPEEFTYYDLGPIFVGFTPYPYLSSQGTFTLPNAYNGTTAGRTIPNAFVFDSRLVPNDTYIVTLVVTILGITKTYTYSIITLMPNNYNYGNWISAAGPSNSIVGLSYDRINGRRYLTVGLGGGVDGLQILDQSHGPSISDLNYTGSDTSPAYTGWCEVYKIPLSAANTSTGALTYYVKDYLVKNTNSADGMPEGAKYSDYFGTANSPAQGSFLTVIEDGFGNLSISMNYPERSVGEGIAANFTLATTYYAFYYYETYIARYTHKEAQNAPGAGLSTYFLGFDRLGVVQTTVKPYPVWTPSAASSSGDDPIGKVIKFFIESAIISQIEIASGLWVVDVYAGGAIVNTINVNLATWLVTSTDVFANGVLLYADPIYLVGAGELGLGDALAIAAAGAEEGSLLAGALTFLAEAAAVCFTGNTMVVVNGGIEKRIDEIKIGDYVVNKDRKALNRVWYVEEGLDTDFHQLYSPDDREPFITINHPIYIDNKLTTPNPESNYEIYPWLGMNERLDPTKIVNATGQKVYNLYVDGDETFIVNGYGTHSIMGPAKPLTGVMNRGLITNNDVKYIHDSFLVNNNRGYGGYLLLKILEKINCPPVDNFLAKIHKDSKYPILQKASFTMTELLGRLAWAYRRFKDKK
jgi:subtilase family serine protease